MMIRFKLLSGLKTLDSRLAIMDVFKGPLEPGEDEYTPGQFVNAAEQLSWFYQEPVYERFFIKPLTEGWNNLPLLSDADTLNQIFDQGLSFFDPDEVGTDYSNNTVLGARYTYIQTLRDEALQASSNCDEASPVLIMMLKYFAKRTEIPKLFWEDLCAGVEGYDQQCGEQADNQSGQVVFSALMGQYDIEEPTVDSFLRGVLITAIYKQAYAKSGGMGESARDYTYDEIQRVCKGEAAVVYAHFQEAFFDSVQALDRHVEPNIYDQIHQLVLPFNMVMFPSNSDLSMVYIGSDWSPSIQSPIYPRAFSLKCLEVRGFLEPSFSLTLRTKVDSIQGTDELFRLFIQRKQDSHGLGPEALSELTVRFLRLLSPMSVRSVLSYGVANEKLNRLFGPDGQSGSLKWLFDLDHNHNHGFLVDMLGAHQGLMEQDYFCQLLMSRGFISDDWMIRFAEGLDFSVVRPGLIAFLVVFLDRQSVENFSHPLAKRLSQELSAEAKFRLLHRLGGELIESLVDSLQRLGILDEADYLKAVAIPDLRSSCRTLFLTAPILDVRVYSEIVIKVDGSLNLSSPRERWSSRFDAQELLSVWSTVSFDVPFESRFKAVIDSRDTPSCPEKMIQLLFGGPFDWSYVARILDSAGTDMNQAQPVLDVLMHLMNYIPLKSDWVDYLDKLSSHVSKSTLLLHSNSPAWCIAVLLDVGFFEPSELAVFSTNRLDFLPTMASLMALRPKSQELVDLFWSLYVDEGQLIATLSLLDKPDLGEAMNNLHSAGLISFKSLIKHLERPADEKSGVFADALSTRMIGDLTPASDNYEKIKAAILTYGVMNFIVLFQSSSVASDVNMFGLLEKLSELQILSFSDHVDPYLKESLKQDPNLSVCFLVLFFDEIDSNDSLDFVRGIDYSDVLETNASYLLPTMAHLMALLSNPQALVELFWSLYKTEAQLTATLSLLDTTALNVAVRNLHRAGFISFESVIKQLECPADDRVRDFSDALFTQLVVCLSPLSYYYETTKAAILRYGVMNFIALLPSSLGGRDEKLSYLLQQLSRLKILSFSDHVEPYLKYPFNQDPNLAACFLLLFSNQIPLEDMLLFAHGIDYSGLSNDTVFKVVSTIKNKLAETPNLVGIPHLVEFIRLIFIQRPDLDLGSHVTVRDYLESISRLSTRQTLSLSRTMTVGEISFLFGSQGEVGESPAIRAFRLLRPPVIEQPLEGSLTRVHSVSAAFMAQHWGMMAMVPHNYLVLSLFGSMTFFRAYYWNRILHGQVDFMSRNAIQNDYYLAVSSFMAFAVSLFVSWVVNEDNSHLRSISNDDCIVGILTPCLLGIIAKLGRVDYQEMLTLLRVVCLYVYIFLLDKFTSEPQVSSGIYEDDEAMELGLIGVNTIENDEARLIDEEE